MPNSAMKLAKQCLDIGLMTSRIAEHSHFWAEVVGLRLDHRLDVGDGREQHRYDIHGSVLKVNHFPDQDLPPASTGGLVGLKISNSRRQLGSLQDPDGNAVTVANQVAGGTADMAVRLRTHDVGRLAHFYVDALGFEPVSASEVRCGRSLLIFEHGERLHFHHALTGLGFRYLTVQIFDADQAHRHVLDRGGREGAPPRNLRDVARFSFVHDPDGNWIELSARASLIGRR